MRSDREREPAMGRLKAAIERDIERGLYDGAVTIVLGWRQDRIRRSDRLC